MKKQKVCIVTGTRAEYGLLTPLMRRIKNYHNFDLQIVATGMHLSPEFGLTYKNIEEDGFNINEKVEMLLSSDTPSGVVKSMGIGTIGFADVFTKLRPDLLIILGDRFEMLAAAQTALIFGLPIAHIHGGEQTFGAYDDAIRHSITKMATFHFTSSESHRQRVIQLGENPSKVWNVGALGIENITKMLLLSKKELYSQLSIRNDQPYFLITYHPETAGETDGIHSILAALQELRDYNLIFTKSNADNGGRLINEKIKDYISSNPNAHLFDSLGQLRYLSAVKHAEAVIGNSSSGLIEVPYLNTPTVNCGGRQSGRECPSSVFHTELDVHRISLTIKAALQYKGPYDQIYGDGKTSEKIINCLKGFQSFSIKKEFYNL
ncbi:UDP-N-acetylglucosamine 2-epimerase [Metabacillus sp. FJAT-52054]|uniref:UDP-N-acetylglucosamine 2-epimerase n=1 Tax=Metabacillus sediminis TaxID=3117746 RepID=A0ABZ2NFU5_9BACI